MRIIVLAVVFMVGMTGCAGNQGNPAITTLPGVNSQSTESNIMDNGPYRLWGEWNLYFNTEHTSVEAVPKRGGRFHLNAVKFLESYCKDCLKITKIKNNGDGTIDVTVRITHPFPNNPEYTGFDVKGIIMFEGSHETKWGSVYMYPFEDPFRVSWRLAGDPELLNQDGYTPRWNPDWDEGSSMPMFNYWPGKYSHGTPTANLNAFLNFNTDEERHIFRVGQSVERTYHIWLPPGPVVSGYAVEACWVPPTVTPVKNPLNDFPFSANQPEPYYFHSVCNNNEVITHINCCGSTDGCDTFWIDAKQWYGDGMTHYLVSASKPWWNVLILNCGPCSYHPDVPPPNDYSLFVSIVGVTDMYPENGTYRTVAVVARSPYGKKPEVWAYDVFDCVIDIK
jgi:hypothetical protein